MSILQEELELIEKNEARVIFIDKWSNSMEYINTTMRAIKKVQRNCNLLHMCIHDSSILETEYSCLIFDKLVRNDDLIQYMIYNKELKSVSRITTSENLFTYRYYKFKIYMFEDEANLKSSNELSILGFANWIETRYHLLSLQCCRSQRYRLKFFHLNDHELLLCRLQLHLRLIRFL